MGGAVGDVDDDDFYLFFNVMGLEQSMRFGNPPRWVVDMDDNPSSPFPQLLPRLPVPPGTLSAAEIAAANNRHRRYWQYWFLRLSSVVEDSRDTSRRFAHRLGIN